MERQEESWQDIEGFEGLYAVSDKGRVWSYKRRKFLSPGKNNSGYLKISLCKNGKEFYKRIHRLVAEGFIENPEGYPEVNHKNEIKTDNKVQNLEWCSRQQNAEFSLSKAYVLYDKYDNRIEIYNMEKFARENGLNFGHLAAVARGEKKSYSGYTKEPGTELRREGQIRLLSPEGEVFTFQNIKEAENYIGCFKGSISNLVKGKRNHSKGWRLYPLDGIFAFT